MSTSVLIVDDHDVVRQGLRAVLEDAGGFTLVGEAGSTAEALFLAMSLQPDVAIIDLKLADGSGLDLMRDMRDRVPETRVLVLSMHSDEAYLVEAVRLGAIGYIVKGAPSSEIVRGLRAAAQGNRFFSSLLPSDIVAAALGADTSAKTSFASLSSREIDVLRLVARGLTSKQIGEALDIGARTVESHRLHILRKLGLTSSSDLMAYAVRHDLLTAAP